MYRRGKKVAKDSLEQTVKGYAKISEEMLLGPAVLQKTSVAKKESSTPVVENIHDT